MLEKFLKSVFYIFAGFTIINFFYYIASYLSQCPGCYGAENADLTFIPALAHNLIHEKGNFNTWSFSRTPFLFPDLFIFLILNIFSSNFILNIALYTLFQFLFFISIILLLFKETTNYKSNWLLILSFTFIIFLLSNEVVRKINNELLIGLYNSAYHFGSYLLILTGLFFFLKICKDEKPKLYAVLFFILSIISTVSDVIFAFYLLLPLFMTLVFSPVFNFFPKKKLIHLILLVLLSGLCGYFAYRCMPIHFHPEKKFFHFYISNIIGLIYLFINLFKTDQAIFICFMSFLLFGPLSLIQSFRENAINNEKWLNFTIFFLIVMIFPTLLFFIITDNSLHVYQTGYLGLRHLQPVILTPIFLGLPLLIYKHTHINEFFKKKSFATIILLLIFIATLNRPSLQFLNFTHFYPNYVACFDSNAQKLKLHNGLSNYWVSRPITMYNQSGIHLASIDSKFSPYWFMNSSADYQRNQYDFLVSNQGSNPFLEKNIITKFGKPYTTFTCPGNYTFYVYKGHELDKIFAKYDFHTNKPMLLK